MTCARDLFRRREPFRQRAALRGHDVDERTARHLRRRGIGGHGRVATGRMSVFSTQWASRAGLPELEDMMLENSTIVVGVDLRETSKPAVEAAKAIAERFGAARVVLVHSVKEGGPLSGLTDAHQRIFDRAKSKLATVDLEIEDCQIERVVRTGSPARVLVEVADESSARLIIVSSHGFGALRRAIVGSVAGSTARVAHCPVLVVGPRREGRGQITSVTAAIDLSSVSERVVRSAVTFACCYGAPVKIISVFEYGRTVMDDLGDPDPRVGADDLVRARNAYREALENYAEMGRSIDVHVDVQILEGPESSEVIMRDVERNPPSLLVIGTSGHGRWTRLLLGATADQLISETSVPVLIIPVEAPALEGCQSVS